MDCCNYMQYRQHQQYYGASQYYEPVVHQNYHHGDFYAHHGGAYQDYYGTAHYYQQWPCVPPFPDYVYNPKEARIRKAMREATRGPTSAAMMQRMGAARRALVPPHAWGQPPPTPTSQQPPSHEELMMQPMAPSMQPPPVYGGGGGEPFLDAMTAYNKLEAAPPPSANYMQGNPLAQLQQQTAEMWPEYQAMRTRSTGNPYIMDEVSPYAPTPELSASLMMDKEAAPATPAPPPSSEPEPDKEPEREHFVPVFEQPEESKMKKPLCPVAKPSTKPLPDFNEAFGSTERGRFQSPPDPRLGPNKGYLEYFFDSSPLKFDDYQI